MRARSDSAPSFYRPYIDRMLVYDETPGGTFKSCIISNILMDDDSEDYEEVTYHVVNSISFDMTPFKTISFWIAGDFMRGTSSNADWAPYTFTVDFYRPGRIRINQPTQAFQGLGGDYIRVNVDVTNINEQAYFDYRFKGDSHNYSGTRPYIAGVVKIELFN